MKNSNAIPAALAAALEERGYDKLTPVQEAVIAPELAGQDLLVSAQTGSGKTVAFGLAMAERLLDGDPALPPGDKPLALVIAPTRELALQVKKELQWLYRPAGGFLATCVGGMNMSEERKALKRGVHIVVGTPGRLCDHIDRGSLDLTDLKTVVLDEADEMLNMGFRDELEAILGATPDERRTLMFSATVPSGIGKLAKKYQKNAVRVNTAAESSQHIDIDYKAMVVGGKDGENAIINVLRFYDAKNAIVFCQTRAAVNRMTSRFNNRGFKVVALSGELSQKDRTNALQAMRDGRARVCIATDVAARGIDLPDLELVIHGEIPKNSEVLLHRSGRTGRAGRKGTCVLIVPHSARRKTERLLRDANVEAEWKSPPSAQEVLRRDDERLMNEPNLSKQSSEKDLAVADQLIEKFGARQMAAAYVHLYRSKNSAPEELRATKAFDPSVHEDGGRRGGKGKGRGRRDYEGDRERSRGRRDKSSRGRGAPKHGTHEDSFVEFADVDTRVDSGGFVDKPKGPKKKKPHKKKLARAAEREARVAKGKGARSFDKPAGKSSDKPRSKPGSKSRSKPKGKSGGGEFALKRKKRK